MHPRFQQILQLRLRHALPFVGFSTAVTVISGATLRLAAGTRLADRVTCVMTCAISYQRSAIS
jgi:hypothetical protein